MNINLPETHFHLDHLPPLDQKYSRNLALDNYGHSNYYGVYDDQTKDIAIKWVGDM